MRIAASQTVVNSTFQPSPGPEYASWGYANNWSPAEVPNNSPERIYNVTIRDTVHTNVDATVSNLTVTGTGFIYNRGHSLAVTGHATLEDPYLTVYSYDGEATFSAGSLSSFSDGTLTGTYEFGTDETGSNWATLQIGGADVRTLSGATVSLSGPRTHIVDEFGNDGLRNLAHIDSGSTLSLSGHQTVLAGPFTNDGILGIGSSIDQPGRFTVTGVLTNFDAASRTLTGGNYGVGGYPNQPAVFQFAGADIVHNAATIGLNGPLAKITDHNGNDALRNFAHNTPAGLFYVAERDFSLGGNFTNEGVLILYSAALSVAGSLTNFDPATRTLTGGTYQISNLGGGPAKFIFEGADIVNNAASIHLRWNDTGIFDENANDALRNFNHNLPGGEFTITDSHVITAAADFTNAGSINVVGYFVGAISQAHFQIPEGHRYIQTAGRTTLDDGRFTGPMEINGGSLTTAANVGFPHTPAYLEGDLTIRDAFFDPLAFNVNGSVHLLAGAQLLTPSEGYELFNYDHFGVSGTFTAGGTLQISTPRFRPASTASVPVVTADGGVVGTFNNAPPGGRVPTTDGLGSFAVSYTPTSIFLSNYQAIPLAAQLLNISTRVQVLTGNNVAIAGFIVFGYAPKKVIVRGLGPSLNGSGVVGTLQNPALQLHDDQGGTITTNNNWRDSQATEIQASGLAPSDDRESAIVATLQPGVYTAVLVGEGNTTGTGLVEVYDLAPEAQSKLANISTRGFVDPDNVLIGGFIAGGTGPGNVEVVVRGIGLALGTAGLTGFLPDPILELRNSQGVLLGFNDDFADSPENLKLIHPNLQVYNGKDAALPAALPPGHYTAIVRGKNGASGVALVEFYDGNR
jgi:hypothetical protein